MSFHPQLFAAADQAVEYVRRRIENGVFVPGRLPPERELARQNISISRCGHGIPRAPGARWTHTWWLRWHRHNRTTPLPIRSRRSS